MSHRSISSSTRSEKDRVFFWVHFITGFGDGLLLPLTATLLLACFPLVPIAPVAGGLLITAAGAFIFGWARYAGEYKEIRQYNPEHSQMDAEREAALLNHIGIEKELIEKMHRDREREKEEWLVQLKENGMHWEKRNRGRAVQGGLQTAAGFLCGGLLCLTPYFLAFEWGPVPTKAIFDFDYPLLLIWPLFLLAVQGMLRGALIQRSLLISMLRYVTYGVLIFLSLYLLMIIF